MTSVLIGQLSVMSLHYTLSTCIPIQSKTTILTGNNKSNCNVCFSPRFIHEMSVDMIIRLPWNTVKTERQRLTNHFKIKTILRLFIFPFYVRIQMKIKKNKTQNKSRECYAMRKRTGLIAEIICVCVRIYSIHACVNNNACIVWRVIV